MLVGLKKIDLSGNPFKLFTDSWAKATLPLIKRVFPTMAAKDFVAVQPMSQPSGLVFYLDFKYGYVAVIWDEELWWEENDKGEWVCPETLDDHKINDHESRKQLDDWLVIPKWEVDQQIKYKDGMGNKQEKPFGYYPISKLPPPTVQGTLQKSSKTNRGRMYPKNMSYGE